MTDNAQLLLQETFGYKSFRPLQKEIIHNLLNRKDTLAIMPTGGGKSLCYQIPAIIFEGLTVVVSPLISLMKDQVEQLNSMGIEATYLNSTLPSAEYQEIMDKIPQNYYHLLYVAPETLLMQRTQNLLKNTKLECIAIDEAHCISEWGHDFRPEYRQLIEIRKEFPNTVCAAFTATATKRVQEDIKQSLAFASSNTYIASFNRKNLFIEIRMKNNANLQIVQFLKQFPDQSGIIYCTTRRDVDELTDFLEKQGFSVKGYHAGLTDNMRKENQELFIRDDVQIMVATIAFGMGINKPNIRFVVHYHIPANIESYYQQIGRAGRDGLNAHCLLLFGYGDIGKIRYFINQKSDQEKNIANMQLNAIISLAEAENCRRLPILSYFGENYTNANCQMCDNCLTEDKKESIDITIEAQKFLSCIRRTGETFGANHIIDILRGSKSQKILKFKHEKVSTYGIGMNLSKKEWLYLSRQLIQKKILIQDEKHGSLKLTDKAMPVLKGEVKTSIIKRSEIHEDSNTIHGNGQYNPEFYQLLKVWRKEKAVEANVPPYIIFGDKTLTELATFFPHSKENMLHIHGIGLVKFNRYGESLLALIHDYCSKHKIKELPKNSPELSNQSNIKKRRYMEVGEAYNSGASLLSLQKEYDVTISTIHGNLFKYWLNGHSLRQSREFLDLASTSDKQQSNVFKAFDKHGTDYLNTVFEALNRGISYEDLHLLRLYYLSGIIQQSTENKE